MKKKYLIAIAVLGLFFLCNQKTPEDIGMTNQFIGTYACETDPQCYLLYIKMETFTITIKLFFIIKVFLKNLQKTHIRCQERKLRPKALLVKNVPFDF